MARNTTLDQKWTAALDEHVQIGSSGPHFLDVKCSTSISHATFVLGYLAARVRNVAELLAEQHRLLLYIAPDDFAKHVISESLGEEDRGTILIRTYTDDMVETGALVKAVLVTVIDSHAGRWPTNAVLAAAAVVQAWAELDEAGTHFCGTLVTVGSTEQCLWRAQAIEQIFKTKLSQVDLSGDKLPLRYFIRLPRKRFTVTVKDVAYCMRKRLYMSEGKTEPRVNSTLVITVAPDHEARKLRMLLDGEQSDNLAHTVADLWKDQDQPVSGTFIITPDSGLASLAQMRQVLEQAKGRLVKLACIIDPSVRFVPDLGVDDTAYVSCPETVRRWSPIRDVFLPETRDTRLVGTLLRFAERPDGVRWPPDLYEMQCETEPLNRNEPVGLYQMVSETVFCLAHFFSQDAQGIAALLAWPEDEDYTLEMFHRLDYAQMIKVPMLARLTWQPMVFRPYHWVFLGFDDQTMRAARLLQSGKAGSLPEALLLSIAESSSTETAQVLAAIVGMGRDSEQDVMQLATSKETTLDVDQALIRAFLYNLIRIDRHPPKMVDVRTRKEIFSATRSPFQDGDIEHCRFAVYRGLSLKDDKLVADWIHVVSDKAVRMVLDRIDTDSS